MKNSKGETLPQPYYDLALMRREQQKGSYFVKNWQKEFEAKQEVNYAFDWLDAPEKEYLWAAVCMGKTPEIPAASLAELEAWRKSREENKQEAMVADELRDDTTDTTDWKAKYEALEKEANELTAALKELGAKYDELKYGDPDRNWIAECAMGVAAGLSQGTHLSPNQEMIEYALALAEAWAAEGKNRGHIN